MGALFTQAAREVCVISDADRKSANISWLLSHQYSVHTLNPGDIGRAKPKDLIVVDIDLKEPSHLVGLRRWLQRRPNGGKAIFAVDRGVHADAVRALAAGASDLIERPLERIPLIARLADAPTASFPGFSAGNGREGIGPAVDALRDIFSSAFTGDGIDQMAVNAAGELIVSHLSSVGISPWIETVRQHHSQTYQHSLLVTGFAVAFGQRLGLSEADQRRLSVAGLVHDIGKAKIPLTILEKAGPLDEAELQIMRQHPLYGLEALRESPDMPRDIINTAVLHHEYLDGSGYPYGLRAGEISDLVRILTIADVFGAMMERRSYKEPVPSAEAYEVLLDMGPKLDADLVRAFLPVAKASARN